MSEANDMKTWYVYLLCYPDTGFPFYVGKGTGERINMHEHSAKYRREPNEQKKHIINGILADGKEVLKKKIAEFTNEQDAYLYEWAMVNLYHETVVNMRPGGKKPQPARTKISNKAQELIPTKEYYTIEEVAKALGKNRATVYNRMNLINLKGHKFKGDRKTYLSHEEMEMIKSVFEKPWLTGEKTEDENAA